MAVVPPRFNRMPLIAMLLGSTIAFVVFIAILNNDYRAVATKFSQEHRQFSDTLFKQLGATSDSLSSLSILFLDGRTPSSQNFSSAVQRVMTRTSSLKAMEYIPIVLESERTDIEIQGRTFFPRFQISEKAVSGRLMPAANRAQYYPVFYIEPLVGNEAVVGYDLGSNTERLEPLLEAKDLGNPVYSQPIQLLQSGALGILAFYPLYLGETDTAEARRDNATGFLAGVYDVAHLFRASGILSVDPEIHYALHDITDTNNRVLAYPDAVFHDRFLLGVNDAHISHTHGPKIDFLGPLIAILRGDPLHSISDVELFGRHYELQSWSNSSYTLNHLGNLHFIAMIVLLLLTGAVTLLVWRTTSREQKHEDLVEAKTERLTEANKILDHMSKTDELTGLANKRGLMEYLQSEWLRGTRSHAALGIIVVDIDGFKPYNDHSGHVRGDDTRKRVAQCMVDCMLRSTDLVARFGGDEFVIILPDTTDAEEVALRVVKAVSDLAIPNVKSVTDMPVVTISAGVGTFYANTAQDPVTILGLVDTALGDSKKAGGNQVSTVHSLL